SPKMISLSPSPDPKSSKVHLLSSSPLAQGSPIRKPAIKRTRIYDVEAEEVEAKEGSTTPEQEQFEEENIPMSQQTWDDPNISSNMSAYQDEVEADGFIKNLEGSAILEQEYYEEENLPMSQQAWDDSNISSNMSAYKDREKSE